MNSPALFTGPALPLTAQGLESCSSSLGVGLPELWAVLQVETRGCGFLPDRRPAVLFERHHFHLRTQGRFDATHPELSCPKPGGYAEGGGAAEHARLAQAVALAPVAALQATSWGLGQVMGFNAASLGYGSVGEFVRRQLLSEDEHLRALTAFVRYKGLAEVLRRHEWGAFAQAYNGPNYRLNQYDEKLAEAYARLTAHGLPDLAVREGQLVLTYLGFEPGAVDGDCGPRTTSALRSFQSQVGLFLSGRFDVPTVAALHERHDHLPRNMAMPGQEVARG